MSNYGYPDASQQGNQQYDPYSSYQQYPGTPQVYSQLGLPHQEQYRSLPPNLQPGLPYGSVSGIPLQHSEASTNHGYHQDYSNVYGQVEDIAAVQQQHTYLPQQQHLPPTPRLNYQQSLPLPLLQPAQPLIPTPHLPNQTSPVIPLPNTALKSSVRSAPPVQKTSAPPAKRQKTNARKSVAKKVDRPAANDASEDDEYTMDGMKTKSGRKVHKPPQFTPSSKAPSRKRGAPVKKPALEGLFCKVCDRGHSPKSNLIVFCDGCDATYHQLCHVPIIDNLLITLPDAEWFCASCDQKRGQRKLEMGSSGADLTEEQKKSYLAGLPTSHLVQLVLYSSSQHPELTLFSPNAASMLDKVHKKHEAAIQEERAKMVPLIYLPVPGEDLPTPQSSLSQIEEQILAATKALDRPCQNRDIIEYIETNYVIDPQTFRFKCAEQISRLVSDGHLLKDGTSVVTNRQFNEEQNGDQKVKTSGQKSAGSHGKTLDRLENSTNQEMSIEDTYPRVEGIKLPPEDPVKDGFHMQETDSPAFVHVKLVNGQNDGRDEDEDDDEDERVPVPHRQSDSEHEP